MCGGFIGDIIDSVVDIVEDVVDIVVDIVEDVIGSNFFINHIRSFNPDINDSLYGWVNSQI